MAVQGGDADLEFSDMTVEVPCHEPLIQQFSAAHLRLDAAPAVIADPSSTERAVQIFRDPQGAFRAMAPAVMAFHGFPFLRGGMTACAPRSAMVSWNLLVS